MGNEKKIGRRIGLLGGTFDPIHMTHLYMAEVVKQECKLDEVWFVPAKIPPHKQDQHMLAGYERLHMVKLALEGIAYFSVCDLEFQRKDPSYTIDTIQQLQKEYAQDHFFFIIGADMIEYLPQWHRIEELIDLVTFIGVGRPERAINPNHPYAQKVWPVGMIPSYISSTAIRERKKQGKSVRFLVPERVNQYIEEHHLYE